MKPKKNMPETYQVEAELLELFEIAARYSEEPSVDTLTNKLIARASKQPVSSINAKKYTREEIESLLNAQRKKYQEQKIREKNAQKNVKSTLTAGGIVISAIGAVTGLTIGNVISLAALTGVGVVTAVGAVMAISGSAIKLQIDTSMPDGTKFRFKSLNNKYGNLFNS